MYRQQAVGIRFNTPTAVVHTPHTLPQNNHATSINRRNMFGTKAAVLRGARLIGRRSLHRRQPPDAPAAAAAVVCAGPGLSQRGHGARYSSRRVAGLSTAAGLKVAAATAARQVQHGGERFPSLLITADDITAE